MTQSPDLIRQQVRNEFDIAAATYDRVRPMRNASVPLLQAANLRPGLRVLDVACGTGFIAIPAARAVGPTGFVEAIDLSPAMVMQVQRNAASAGLTNMTAVAADAEALDFPDDRFDVVTSGFSLRFLPNVAGALREWLRVLKPGGLLHVSSWSNNHGQPLFKLLREHLERNGLAGQTGASSWPQAEECYKLLETAGYTHIKVATHQAGFFHRDLAELWNELSTTPAATALAMATPEVADRVKNGLLGEVAALLTPQGIWHDGTVHIASGQKP